MKLYYALDFLWIFLLQVCQVKKTFFSCLFASCHFVLIWDVFNLNVIACTKASFWSIDSYGI